MAKFNSIVVIVLCFLTMLCANSASGQGNHRKFYPGQRRINSQLFEIGAGPSITSIQDNDPLLLPYGLPSFAASVGLVKAFTTKWCFTLQTMYELKRSKATQHFPDVESEPASYYVTTSYVTFSPSLRRYFGDTGVFLEGGPFVSFLLLGRKMMNDGGIGSPYAATDVGITTSIGLTPWRKVPKGFNLRLVNNIGLQDIDHHTGTKEWTQSTALILGMRFKMR